MTDIRHMLVIVLLSGSYRTYSVLIMWEFTAGLAFFILAKFIVSYRTTVQIIIHHHITRLSHILPDLQSDLGSLMPFLKIVIFFNITIC